MACTKKFRKSKNPENLYPRNGIWWIRYNSGGRKVRRSLETRSLRKAKKLRDQILAKRTVEAKFGLKQPAEQKNYRLSEIIERWTESRRADTTLRPSTLKRDDDITRVWILPYFGTLPIAAIDLEEIERFIVYLRTTPSRRTGRPLHPTTVAHVFASLRQIYKYAGKRALYTGINPLEQVDRPPKPGPGRDVVLLVDEAERFLSEISGPVYYKCGLALATGLRWGEVHGLAWDDLELERTPHTLSVRRSYSGPPKNKASAATIPISDDAATLLRRWRTEPRSGDVYVFPNVRGALQPRVVRSEIREINRANKRSGIKKNITPHVFRHTFGTWLYERTRDLKRVQRLMRHATIASTMRYVHDTRDLSEVVNLMPELATPRLKVV